MNCGADASASSHFKVLPFAEEDVGWLGGRDSNPDSQIQSLKPVVLFRSPQFWIVLICLGLGLPLYISAWLSLAQF